MPRQLHWQFKSCQRGIVMVVTLVALVVMLLATIAIIRSVQTSQYSAGNLAFRRDLTNQTDRGIWAGINAITAGIGNSTSLGTAGANYSATMLAEDGHGVPTALYSPGGLNSALAITDNNFGVVIYYVIDRMCTSAPTDMNGQPWNNTNCIYRPAGDLPKTTAGMIGRPTAGSIDQVLYRISVRVDGPRGTQAFAQTTVAY